MPERITAKTFSWKYVIVEFRSFLAQTEMQTFGGSELSSRSRLYHTQYPVCGELLHLSSRKPSRSSDEDGNCLDHIVYAKMLIFCVQEISGFICVWR